MAPENISTPHLEVTEHSLRVAALLQRCSAFETPQLLQRLIQVLHGALALYSGSSSGWNTGSGSAWVRGFKGSSMQLQDELMHVHAT